MLTSSQSSLILLTLALLSGCGRTASVGAALPQAVAPHLPKAMIAGQERTFGFDFERYEKMLRTAAAPPLHVVAPTDMPPQVDNRPYCSPVGNQGKLGACTAFALGRGLREFMQARNGERRTPLSPLWLYYNERVHMGPDYVARDSGATLSDGAWVLSHQGCATEAAWPYLLPQFAIAPSAAADASANTGRLHRPQWLAGLNDARAAIAKGQAVAFGFKAYASLRTVGHDGLMPMPKPGEQVLGGHAVLAVGYDDTRQLLTVRNSWGDAWGDAGYFYMPYAFVQDSFNTGDFWTADG